MKVILLFMLAYCFRSQGQDSLIIVKAGTSFGESISMTDLYQYPQFIAGKLFFRTGDSAVAKFNYNKLLDELQFIGRIGDTLNIANASSIRSVHIQNDVFYYDNGYVKLIKDTNGIKLAEKHTLRLVGKTKIGAYGLANPASAIDSYGTLINETGMYKMVPREDITLMKKTEYYVGDKYNRFVLATRKNLLQHFSKQGRILNTYLKEKNVDLNNRDDLEKLLQFLASL